jgi:hypothetical protein
VLSSLLGQARRPGSSHTQPPAPRLQLEALNTLEKNDPGSTK